MSSRQRRRRLERRRAGARLTVASAGALAVVLGAAPAAEAAGKTYKVTNTSGSATKTGSLPYVLKEVVSDDATPASPDVVTFASDVTGSIKLTTPIEVTDSVYIKGPGARRLTLDFHGDGFRGLYFSGAENVLVSGLSLDDASGTELIYAAHTSLLLYNDTFHDDSDPSNFGTVSSYRGNLKISGCTFDHDYSNRGGALAARYDEFALISNSTFVDDSAEGFGGAILFYNGSIADLADTTLAGNTVLSAGQGSDVYVAKVALAVHDSILGGSAGPGLVVGSGGSLTPVEYSLIQDAAGITAGLNTTDITGESPDLAPLANNGGETNTELPQIGSPALNAGQAFELTTDQRGLARTWKFPGVGDAAGGDGTDIGAAELQPYITGLKLTKAKAGAKETIHGSGFDGTKAVYFGKVKAKKFKVLGDNEIIVTVPKGKGKVAITLKSAAGKTKSVPGGQFHYR